MDHANILINIRKILRSINLESKRIQKTYGISIPQYLTLNYLHSQPEFKSTSKSLKTHLNLNASTVTGIIRRLESKGLVAKLPNEKDKRSTYIHLTALGASKTKEMPPLMHEKLSEKLKTLSSKEIEEIHLSLEKLVNYMGVQNLDASPLIVPEDFIEKSED